MMKVYSEPSSELWPDIFKRVHLLNNKLDDKVKKIIKNVQEQGDKALAEYSKEFDGVELKEIKVSVREIESAARKISNELQLAIQHAATNIRKFHANQVMRKEQVWIDDGINCWRKSVGIEIVGLYIPGGSAPLFSTLLMLAIPAQLAGCKEIIVCTPPGKDGNIHPAILYTASVLNIQNIYKIGGAQAIASMAFGTQTIPAVNKIFGPGNQFVTRAKELIQLQGIAIDLVAGPSELCLLADETAHPDFITADLLSQAEHGIDSNVILITISAEIAIRVKEEITKQLEILPRKQIAVECLSKSSIIILKDREEAIKAVNYYAPEHLIIACREDELIADKIINAGSVFLGNYSPESAGDYATGTNHTLPTNGHAKAFSGVSVDSFVKKITFQKLSQSGLKKISKTVETMAEAEGLQAHANAISIRLKDL